MAASESVNRLTVALVQVAAHLSDQDRGWALVGGLAVSVRSEPRFTRDIDIAVSVIDDRDAEAVTHELVTRGYRVFASLEQESVGRLATVRLVSPAEGDAGVVVDALFASSGIEPELVRDAERIEVLPGVIVPVARLGHLLALKVLSEDDRRPQDRADIVALLREADDTEKARAREAVRLVSERGYARGRDLPAALETFFRAAEA